MLKMPPCTRRLAEQTGFLSVWIEYHSPIYQIVERGVL